MEASFQMSACPYNCAAACTPRLPPQHRRMASATAPSTQFPCGTFIRCNTAALKQELLVVIRRQRARSTCFRAVKPAAPGGEAEGLPPESKEEAVAQACAAIAAQLVATSPKGGSSRKGGKGKGATAALGGFAAAGKRLSVEIPVMDESAAAAVQLAQDLIAGLPAVLQRQFTIVAAGDTSGSSSSHGRSSSGAPLLSMRQCLDDRRVLPGCVLIAAPTNDQLGQVAALLADCSGPAAVLLNAGWAAALAEEATEGGGGVAPEQRAFALSFQPIYVFMPVALKAFVITAQEVAVFRWARLSGAASASSAADGASESPAAARGAWRIFMRRKAGWEAVARMQARPSSVEIEVAFYNASAAASPLTAGAKFLRGLLKGGEQ